MPAARDPRRRRTHPVLACDRFPRRRTPFSMRTVTLLAIGLGVLLGLGGYTFRYAEGLSYFSTDPRACANCHIMRDPYDSWQKASHHTVATCVDCHLPHDPVGKLMAKARNGYFHSKAFTLQDFHEPILITPVNRRALLHNCMDCHAAITDEIRAAGAGHGGDELDCIRCHPAVGHGPPR
jgi:cytochrome c nitrite reductase small subunit